MAPLPPTAWGQTASPQGNRARPLIIIGVAVAMLLVGASVAVTMFFANSGNGDWGGSAAESAGPPILIDLNQPVPGSLTSAAPTRTYEFTIAQPGLVRIAINGDFDSYLELYEGTATMPGWQDDDSGGNLNAMISTSLQPGRYYALVRAYSDGNYGNFTLTVTAPGAGSGGMPLPPPPLPLGPRVTPQTRTGVVATVSGRAPVTTGDQCVVQISAADSQRGLNCRVQVTCAGNMIYGRDAADRRFGFNRCAVTTPMGGIEVIEAHDQEMTANDGDPRIDLLTAQGTITVTDQGDQGLWSVTIRFTSPGSPPTETTAI
jgi:hypothetical protein